MQKTIMSKLEMEQLYKNRKKAAGNSKAAISRLY